MATKFKKYIIRPVRDFCLYHILNSMFSIGHLVNRKLLLKWHGALAVWIYTLDKKTRKSIVTNLEIALGPSSYPEEYDDLGKKLYACLAKTLTDYALFSKLKTKEQFSKYFTYEGVENLQKAYDRGKGVLCMVVHTPGWELSAIMPPILGFPTLGVSSRIKNPALNRLMIDMRESRGMKNVTRDHCFDILQSELAQGKCLIIMIDQDSLNIRGEFLKFFGKDAYTPIGCARLVKETGAALVPMYTVRNDETDTYTFKILPEVPFEPRPTDIETYRYNTQKYNDVIESIIKENPIQWVWMHNRWKTTPEILKSFLDSKKQRNK